MLVEVHPVMLHTTSIITMPSGMFPLCVHVAVADVPPSASGCLFVCLEGILLVCARAGKDPGGCESEERQRGQKWKRIRSKVRHCSKYYEKSGR